MNVNDIYLGNCLELIKQLPDNSVDFIYTDPPYFEQLRSEAQLKSDQKRLEVKKKTGTIKSIIKAGIEVNKINHKGQVRPADWIPEALRVLKKVNMIIWLNMRHQGLEYLLELEKYGLSFYQLTWWKTNPSPMAGVYLKDREDAFYIFKKSPVDYNKAWEARHSIRKHRNNSGSGTDANYVPWHPTPKPLKFVKDDIEKHTKKGDVVLDLFSGSGTTCVASKQLGRQFIGFEIDKTYWEKSKERLQNEGSQTMLDFGEDD